MITPNNFLAQQNIQASVINNKRRIGIQPFNRLLRISFYFYLFSIPFESILNSSGLLEGIASRSSLWSLSRITGLLLIIVLLLSRRPIYCVRLPAIRSFIVYIILYLIAAVVIFYTSDYSISSNLLLTPWSILLFAICCEFFLEPTTRNQGLIILMFAIGLCAFLQINNLAINMESPMAWGSSDMRISAFGEDPNMIGAQYAVGLLIAILSILGIIPSSKRIQIISVCVAGVSLIALVQTGSRSAVTCTFIALLALLLNKQPGKKRIYIWLMCILFISIFGVLVMRNEAFLQRLQESINYGDTSGRLEVYKAAFNLFLESPIIGYGPYRNTQILGIAFGYSFYDTHNVLLWVLTASGLVGFIPFFIGYVMCFIRAFRARIGPNSIAPLVLCIMAVTFSQTAGWDEEKLFWVLLAYGATAIIASPKVKLFKDNLA